MLKGNNPSADILLIGGVPVTGAWGAGEGVTYEEKEIATLTEGCGGETVVNVFNRKTRKVTVKVLSTSLAHKYLHLLLQTQFDAERATGVIPVIPWFHYVSGRGTTVTAAQIQFLADPLDGTAAEVPEVEYKLALNEAQEVPGLLNVP